MIFKVYVPDMIDFETGEILQDSKVEEWNIDCLQVKPKRKRRSKSNGNKNKHTRQSQTTASVI